MITTSQPLMMRRVQSHRSSPWSYWMLCTPLFVSVKYLSFALISKSSFFSSCPMYFGILDSTKSPLFFRFLLILVSHLSSMCEMWFSQTAFSRKREKHPGLQRTFPRASSVDFWNQCPTAYSNFW